MIDNNRFYLYIVFQGPKMFDIKPIIHSHHIHAGVGQQHAYSLLSCRGQTDRSTAADLSQTAPPTTSSHPITLCGFSVLSTDSVAAVNEVPTFQLLDKLFYLLSFSPSEYEYGRIQSGYLQDCFLCQCLCALIWRLRSYDSWWLTSSLPEKHLPGCRRQRKTQ